MEVTENNLPFLDILINNCDMKIWRNIYMQNPLKKYIMQQPGRFAYTKTSLSKKYEKRSTIDRNILLHDCRIIII